MERVEGYQGVDSYHRAHSKRECAFSAMDVNYDGDCGNRRGDRCVANCESVAWCLVKEINTNSFWHVFGTEIIGTVAFPYVPLYEAQVVERIRK